MMHETLRHVHFEGYALKLYDSGFLGRDGRSCLSYAFGKIGECPIFTGSDFYGSPMHSDDSDETLRALVGFLTLRPGDTDAEYFEAYTPEQRAFCDTDAESLGLYAIDPDEGFGLPAFQDMPIE